MCPHHTMTITVKQNLHLSHVIAKKLMSEKINKTKMSTCFGMGQIHAVQFSDGSPH